MIGTFGGWEIVIILLVVLIIFGPARLPKLAQAMGKAIREYKKSGKDIKSEVISEVVFGDEEESKKG